MPVQSAGLVGDVWTLSLGTMGHMRMDIWGRLFRRRREAEAAFYRSLGAAEERVKTPISMREAAEKGAKIRAELEHIISQVEAKIGAPAYVLEGDEQELMVSGQLEEAISRHHDAARLRPAFSAMFATRESKRTLVDSWNSGVDEFLGKANSRDILKDKATIFAIYIINQYDIPCLILTPNVKPSELDDVTVAELKQEAAWSWLRIIDQLSYRFLSQYRDLFVDYLEEKLAYTLALQGCSVSAVLLHARERTIEYASVRDWILDPPHEDRGLLWLMGRYAIAALGAVPTEAAIRAHVELFLKALDQAQPRSLLTGLAHSSS